MKRNPRPTAPRAAAAAENGLAVGAAAVDVGATTIRVTLASHANRAGSFLVSWKQPDALRAGTASKKTKGGIVNATRTINF
jgi:hypothetical protein